MTAWMIEDAESPEETPSFRAGAMRITKRWTNDPKRAMRFASERAARDYAKTFMMTPVRVKERRLTA